MNQEQRTETQKVVLQEKEIAKTSLLDQLIDQAPGAKASDNRKLMRKGLDALLRQILNSTEKNARADRATLDNAIATIDKQISRQVDQVLHAPEFQQLESAWRGLKFLVDRTDFRQNIRISLLNASKADLQSDFLDSPDITYSGLYHHVYTSEYGQHGGSPYSTIIGNYYFGPNHQDVNLMRSLSSIAAMAHAPFISAAGPEFFGLDSFEGLPRIKDLKANFEQAHYAAWRSFRESEDARYVGLTLPRFLLRMPYGADNTVRSFDYEEQVSDSHESYLWGNTAFAMASRLTESFANYGWCPNIIGPRGGGQIDNLPVHTFKSFQGDLAQKIPTEILVSEPREVELQDQGFIALTMRKDSNNACFFSANSVQKPRSFGLTPEGKAAELNYKLGGQLPYIFVISRIAHYIKTIQREHLGSFKERQDLDRELNQWIRQYVADQDHVQAGVRARKPLRQAKVLVEDVEGEPGWYKVDLKVVPHFKYMGAFFTLSLVGKLDTK